MLREEQDSEYARRIQEEIQRCAEEAQRREEEDKVYQRVYFPFSSLRVPQKGFYTFKYCLIWGSITRGSFTSNFPQLPQIVWAEMS